MRRRSRPRQLVLPWPDLKLGLCKYRAAASPNHIYSYYLPAGWRHRVCGDNGQSPRSRRRINNVFNRPEDCIASVDTRSLFFTLLLLVISTDNMFIRLFLTSRLVVFMVKSGLQARNIDVFICLPCKDNVNLRSASFRNQLLVEL